MYTHYTTYKTETSPFEEIGGLRKYIRLLKSLYTSLPMLLHPYNLKLIDWTQW